MAGPVLAMCRGDSHHTRELMYIDRRKPPGIVLSTARVADWSGLKDSGVWSGRNITP
jgi:hypothetical protein